MSIVFPQFPPITLPLQPWTGEVQQSNPEGRITWNTDGFNFGNTNAVTGAQTPQPQLQNSFDSQSFADSAPHTRELVAQAEKKRSHRTQMIVELMSILQQEVTELRSFAEQFSQHDEQTASESAQLFQKYAAQETIRNQLRASLETEMQKLRELGSLLSERQQECNELQQATNNCTNQLAEKRQKDANMLNNLVEQVEGRKHDLQACQARLHELTHTQPVQQGKCHMVATAAEEARKEVERLRSRIPQKYQQETGRDTPYNFDDNGKAGGGFGTSPGYHTPQQNHLPTNNSPYNMGSSTPGPFGSTAKNIAESWNHTPNSGEN
eukprot:TRINITY_DN4090_c0_g1_i1.p1 TRINITY_DN4090_c0_g1~~TRINITY_DN4090_c0_g1_i1.p1  ORF type:complete len:332 (+),score=31.40 TRINITY_DN4090_c0_g1_i1:28-996(+)